MCQPYEILHMTVEEVVRQDPSTARVLGYYHIDICRCWAVTVQTAARAAGVEPQVLAADLRDAPHAGSEIGEHAHTPLSRA